MDPSNLIDDIAAESRFEDVDSEDEFESCEKSRQKYLFLDSHPGYEFSYLQQRKHVAIPIISMPKGNICQIEDLDISNPSPASTTLSRREIYAKTACVMFLPFRQSSDLMSGITASYWAKHQEAIQDKSLSQSGFKVLKNIEERATASKAKSAEEPLKKKTTYQQDEEDDCQEQSNSQDDVNATDLSFYDEDVERQIDDDYQMSNTSSQRTRRTNDYLYDPSTMKKNHLISARLADRDVSLLSSESEEINAESRQVPPQQHPAQPQQGNTHCSYPTLLTFISGTLVGGNYDDLIAQEEEISDQQGDVFEGMSINRDQRIPTLIGVARKVSIEDGKQLDKKQYITYEIIAPSFCFLSLKMELA